MALLGTMISPADRNKLAMLRTALWEAEKAQRGHVKARAIRVRLAKRGKVR